MRNITSQSPASIGTGNGSAWMRGHAAFSATCDSAPADVASTVARNRPKAINLSISGEKTVGVSDCAAGPFSLSDTVTFNSVRLAWVSTLQQRVAKFDRCLATDGYHGAMQP